MLLFEDGVSGFLKKFLPRVLKGVVKGLVWFFLLYFLPTLLLSGLVEEVFPSYPQLFSTFAVIIVLLVVISELLAGTILQYALNIGKTLMFMALFIYALNGGFMAFDFEILHIEIDLRVFLAMLLTISLLGLAKNLLQAIDFLAQKTEHQLII